MRLICPNCDAQYEVDSSAIPEAGRDVQCSSCGHGWFQLPQGDSEADLSDGLYLSPAAAVPGSAALTAGEEDEESALPVQAAPSIPMRRSLDESVLAVLREEAERESAARRAEAETIEVQGELGLPPPVSPMVNQRAPAPSDQDLDFERELTEALAQEDRLARDEGAEAGNLQGAAAASNLGVAAGRGTARRELLPDIEEINSTLRPSETSPLLRSEETEAEARSGFRSGFVLALVLAGLVVAAYVMAPAIAERIPAAAPALEGYVASIDQARDWLDGVIRRATQSLNDLTGGPGA